VSLVGVDPSQATRPQALDVCGSCLTPTPGTCGPAERPQHLGSITTAEIDAIDGVTDEPGLGPPRGARLSLQRLLLLIAEVDLGTIHRCIYTSAPRSGQSLGLETHERSELPFGQAGGALSQNSAGRTERSSDALVPGRPQTLFEVPTPADVQSATFDVTVDGQRFFVLLPVEGDRAQRTNLTLVTDWFDEVSRLIPTQD